MFLSMKSFDGFYRPRSELRVSTDFGGLKVMDTMNVDSSRTATPIIWQSTIELPSVPCEKFSLSFFDGRTNNINPFEVKGTVSLRPQLHNSKGCVVSTNLELPKSDYRVFFSSSDYVPVSHSLIQLTHPLEQSGVTISLPTIPSERMSSSFPHSTNTKSQSSDFEHSIKSFSLGSSFPSQVSPLDGTQTSATRHPPPTNKKSIFVIRASYKISPIETDFYPVGLLSAAGNDKKAVKSYQYGAGKPEVRRIKARQVIAFSSDKTTPGISFSFDPVPFTVVKTEVKMSFVTLIVRCCALIGGVFAASRLIDLLVHRVNECSYENMMDLSMADFTSYEKVNNTYSSTEPTQKYSDITIGKKISKDEEDSDEENNNGEGFIFL